MDKINFFFSYSRKDNDFVLKLAHDLRKAGVNIWMDQLDIPVGERWDRAVEKALKESLGLIVVFSPDAVDSENVMDEVYYALGEDKNILPVLCRTCEIPFRLKRLQYIDFRGGYENGLERLLESLGVNKSRTQKTESVQYVPEKPIVKTTGTPKKTNIVRKVVYSILVILIFGLALNFVWVELIVEGFGLFSNGSNDPASIVGVAILWIIGLFLLYKIWKK